MIKNKNYIETHIGEFLEEEFLKPYSLSQNALAMAIHVPATRINNIVKGKIGITVDTDLRLCKYFGKSEGFFLRIQEEIERVMAKRELEQDLNTIIPLQEKDNFKHKSLNSNHA